MPALVAGIHVLGGKDFGGKDVDGRDKPGHDNYWAAACLLGAGLVA
jgi:hypothetical protein